MSAAAAEGSSSSNTGIDEKTPLKKIRRFKITVEELKEEQDVRPRKTNCSDIFVELTEAEEEGAATEAAEAGEKVIKVKERGAANDRRQMRKAASVGGVGGNGSSRRGRGERAGGDGEDPAVKQVLLRSISLKPSASLKPGEKLSRKNYLIFKQLKVFAIIRKWISINNNLRTIN